MIVDDAALRSRWSVAALYRLLLLWLAGIDLRLTILAVPPLLPLIHRDLALDEKSVAALTGMPVLLFGIMAVPGSLLIARIGPWRALILGLVTIAIASALRGVGPSRPLLFAMTLLMGAGVSVMQPALPSLVSQWFAGAVPLATAVYGNGLLVGEALAAGLTLPLVLPLAGGSWEWSFVLWAGPVWITAGLIIAAGRGHGTATTAGRRTRWWPEWRDPQVWRLGLIQGGSSLTYFGCNAFIPDFLHASGHPALVNASLTALNVGQLPASFLILLLAPRLAGRRAPLFATAIMSLLGVGALLVPQEGAIIAGAGVIGFSSAFLLILTLALPPLLAPPDEVHRLSAGMLAVGYTLAFLLPFLGGALWDATGVAETAFVPAALGALVVFGASMALRPVERRP
jgi:CP family cyanate transporter-like MFS transporter